MLACRNADAYHTAYCISGLSAAQHHVYPSPARREEVRAAWEGEDGVRASVFAEALCWTEEDGGSHIVGSVENRVVRLFSAPVFIAFLAEEVTECYAPAIQFDNHTHGRNNDAFL